MGHPNARRLSPRRKWLTALSLGLAVAFPLPLAAQHNLQGQGGGQGGQRGIPGGVGQTQPNPPGAIRHRVIALPPGETWAQTEWPVVVVFADANQQHEALQHYGPLVSGRGAMLVVMPGGDAESLDSVLGQLAGNHPIHDFATVLVGSGNLSYWTLVQARRLPEAVCGVVLINPMPPRQQDRPLPLGPLPEGLPAQAVALLVEKPDPAVVIDPAVQQRADVIAAQAQRFQAELTARNIETWFAPVEHSEFLETTRIVLNAMLPEAPPRRYVTDVLSGLIIQAPDGWMLYPADETVGERSLSAVARPLRGGAGVEALPEEIRIVSGGLGEWTYEEYVETTRRALAEAGVELLRQERLGEVVEGHPVHAFVYRDARRDNEKLVVWLQVGGEGRLISLRYVGPPAAGDLLNELRDMLRDMLHPLAAVRPDAPPAPLFPRAPREPDAPDPPREPDQPEAPDVPADPDAPEAPALPDRPQYDRDPGDGVIGPPTNFIGVGLHTPPGMRVD